MFCHFEGSDRLLLIEKGRYSNITRDKRLCSCGTGVQTILHCFTECPVTRPLLQEKTYANLNDVFNDENICVLIHKVCTELRIRV